VAGESHARSGSCLRYITGETKCSMLSTGLGADPPTYPNLVPMTRVVDKHELRTSIYIC
jgi:hypothetical protein